MSGLFVNFFECNFQKDSYLVRDLNYSGYDSKEKYEALRDAHKDFAFTRHGDRIYYWKLAEKAVDNLNGEIVSFRSSFSIPVC